MHLSITLTDGNKIELKAKELTLDFGGAGKLLVSDSCRDWFCFHATTDRPIKLTAASGQVWTPQSSDLRFQPLPDAALPAQAPAARIAQMKQFVRRFSAHDSTRAGGWNCDCSLRPSIGTGIEKPG